MDVFRPRARLPLDPFPVQRTWSAPPPSELVLPSPPQVILLLGVPDVRSILTSPRLSTCLVICATHDPSSLLHALDSKAPGPSIRILQLSAPLDVHEAGAIRLISVLNRAGRVANEWRRQQRQNPHERTILHLLPDSPDGDFCIVKPLTFAPLPSPAPSLERPKRFSFGKSEEPKINNNYPQYYYLSPSRVPRLPSAIDATHEYSRYPSPTPNVFVPHTNNKNGTSRSFDAILNFLPDNIPDKALLKHAILVTTLSAQYLAGGPSSSSSIIQDIQTYHSQRHALSSATPSPTIALPTPPRAAFLTGKFKSAKPTRRATVTPATDASDKQKRRFSSFISSSSSGFPFGLSPSNQVPNDMESPSELGETVVPRPPLRAGSTKKKNRFSSFIPGYGYSTGFGGVSEDGLGGVSEPVPKSKAVSSSMQAPMNVNAHIVHILPASWARAEGDSPSSNIPFPNAKGQGSSKLNPNNNLSLASSSSSKHKGPTPARGGAGQQNPKPKLVQGIEQFLLGFSSPSPSSMLQSSSSSRNYPSRPTPTHSPSSSTSTSSSSGRPSFSSFSSFSPSGSTSTSATNTPGTTPPASRPASTYDALPGTGILPSSSSSASLAMANAKGKGKAKATDEIPVGASRPPALPHARSTYRHSYHAYYATTEKKPSTRWSMDDGSCSSPTALNDDKPAAAVADKVVPYLVSHAEFVRALGCVGCAWVEGRDEAEVEVEEKAEEEGEEDDREREVNESDDEEDESTSTGTSASSHQSHREHTTIEKPKTDSLVKPLTTGEAILLGLLDFPSFGNDDELSLLGGRRAWIGRGDVVIARSGASEDEKACCAHAVWRAKKDEEERRRRVREAKARARARAEALRKAEEEKAAEEEAEAEKAKANLGLDVADEKEQAEAVKASLDLDVAEVKEEEENVETELVSTTTTLGVTKEEDVQEEKEEDEECTVDVNVEVVEKKDVHVDVEEKSMQQLPTPPESRSGCSGEEEDEEEEGNAGEEGVDVHEVVDSCAPVEVDVQEVVEEVEQEQDRVVEVKQTPSRPSPSASASPSRSSSMIIAMKLGAELDAEAEGGVVCADVVSDAEAQDQGEGRCVESAHGTTGDGEPKEEVAEEKGEEVVSSSPNSDPPIQTGVKSKKLGVFSKIQRSLSLSSSSRHRSAATTMTPTPTSASPALSTAPSSYTCADEGAIATSEEVASTEKKSKSKSKPRRSISFRTKEVNRMPVSLKKRWNLGMMQMDSVRRSVSERGVGEV